MGMRVRGIKKTVAQFERLKRGLPDAAGDGAKDYADFVFFESQILVPKRTLALMQSGEVRVRLGTGKTRSYAVHYGDSDVDRVGVFYAAAVHELLDHHHPPPTQAKYVQQPLEENVGVAKEMVARQMRELVRKSFR